MAYTQEQVNQMARDAAAQAGGTISYSDAINAAINAGIPAHMVLAAGNTGVITGLPSDWQSAVGATTTPTSQQTAAPVGALTQASNTPSTANNVLGGVILAGDSWLSNPANTTTIGSQIGQNVTNVAVGGSTTADTLNQLNSFIGAGGTFAPNSTVMLDIGGNDLLQGVSADSIRDNLNQILSTLGSRGVNVVLSGAPSVGSVADVTGSTNLAMHSIFNEAAARNPNVTLVDSMAGLLNQKNLVDETGFHMNEAGRNAFNAALSNAYLQSQGLGPIQYSDQAIREFVAANNLTPDQAVALAPSFGLTGDRVRGALAATAPSGALGQMTTQPSADPIEQLYQQYAGRSADPSGLEYWRNQFGSEVDPTEAAIFQRAVAENASKGIETSATGTSFNSYFEANPDVAAEYLRNTQGMTPDQFAQTHYQRFGVNEGRAAPPGALSQFSTSAPANYVNPLNNFGAVDNTVLAEGLSGGDTSVPGVVNTRNQIRDQIVNVTGALEGKNWAGSWGGGGEGAYDSAANILANKGVTDLRNLAVEKNYEQGVAQGEFYNGQRVQGIDENEDGIIDKKGVYNPTTEQFEYLSADAKVTPGVVISDAFGESMLRPLTEDELKTYNPTTGKFDLSAGNKLVDKTTGKTIATSDSNQFILDKYDTGNFLRGKEKFFGIQMTDDGIAVPYQSSQRSGMVVDIMSDPILGKVASAAAGYFGGPLAVGALNVAAGADFEDALKAAVLSYVAPKIGAEVAGSTASALGATGSQIAGNIASNFVRTGDLQKAFLYGGLGGGVDYVASQIPGFTDMPKMAQNALKDAVRAELSGQKVSDAVIQSAIESGMAAARTELTGTGGGITNRTYDDTITDAGADAFIKAKEVGADDDTALAAANAVTGTGSAVTGATTQPDTTTKAPAGGFDLGEFAGVDAAIQRNTTADAARASALQTISSQPKFSDAFAQARQLLGPGQTFEWNGKQYSTATFAERPDLSGNVVPGAASTTAGAGRGSYAGYDAEADAAAKGTPKTVGTAQQAAQETGFWQNLSNSLSNQMKLSSQAANDYLKNNPNSPITNNVSTALEAAGELVKNVAGGTALALDNKPLSDAFVKGGNELMKFGQSIGTGPQDTKNWNETLSLVDKAKGWEKLGVIAGRILDGTSGLARQAEVELRQELPALFLGGGSAKGILVASGLVDTADTGGSAVLDGYQDVIDRGGSHKEALTAGRKAGAAAAASEAVIQATLGKLGDLAVGKLDNIIAKGTGRVAGEGLTEAGQEGSSSVAQDIVLGRDIDINKALTQSVVGGAVGKTTSATTSPVSAAQDVGTTSDAIGAMNTNISTALSSGDKAAAGPVITESIFTAVGNGADAVTAAGSAVDVALENGADLSPTVNAAVNASLSDDASNAPQVAESILGSVVANNGDVNQASEFVMDALIDSGMSFEQASKISTDAVTKVTSDANINTQTTVNPDTNVTTTVTTNANTNVITETNTNPNTNTKTTVTTDANNNTQTTTVVDTQTGEIINEVVTSIPEGYTPPVIDGGAPGGVTSGTTTAATKSTPPKGKTPSRTGAAGLAGGIGATLPSFFGIGTDPLTSRETQKAIDPLQRVMKAQAELENTAMMQQIDPRLLSVLQQRMAPEQQANPQQQFDKDIGALSRLLSGDSGKAANEQGYYSYGAEDSIDDILGGKAANYKEGGYVAPLMAEGGMALPLLAKSGGALDHYNGRENFKDGKHVAGEGDGQSDDIPAWLADGEFVFPADVVSALGNGSTKAGTDKLYEMMHSIRDRARSKGPKDLPPPALKSPLDYLKSRKRSQ